MPPLSYTHWPGRNWKVSGRSGTGVDDLDATDVVTFALTATNAIKLNGITCTHSPIPAPVHDAREWKNRDCNPPSGISNKVAGTTTSGRNFEIESSEVVVAPGQNHNKLTCRVILPPPAQSAGAKAIPGTTTSESTSGGVCWTAEDG